MDNLENISAIVNDADPGKRRMRERITEIIAETTTSPARKAFTAGLLHQWHNRLAALDGELLVMLANIPQRSFLANLIHDARAKIGGEVGIVQMKMVTA